MISIVIIITLKHYFLLLNTTSLWVLIIQMINEEKKNISWNFQFVPIFCLFLSSINQAIVSFEAYDKPN